MLRSLWSNPQPHQMPCKRNAPQQISAPQTPRLVQQPKDPLATGSLHPQWRTFEASGKEVSNGPAVHDNDRVSLPTRR